MKAASLTQKDHDEKSQPYGPGSTLGWFPFLTLARLLSAGPPRSLLLDLLQQPVGVIAGNQRDVRVSANLFQQRDELLRI